MNEPEPKHLDHLPPFVTIMKWVDGNEHYVYSIGSVYHPRSGVYCGQHAVSLGRADFTLTVEELQQRAARARQATIVWS